MSEHCDEIKKGDVITIMDVKMKVINTEIRDSHETASGLPEVTIEGRGIR